MTTLKAWIMAAIEMLNLKAGAISSEYESMQWKYGITIIQIFKKDFPSVIITKAPCTLFQLRYNKPLLVPNSPINHV